MTRRSLVLVALVAAATPLAAQQRALPLKYPAKPTVAAITPGDLMSRLYVFADDSMMGRSAGTVYHDKGTAYIARELARIGLTPAGDNGTYFQLIPLFTRTLAAGTRISVDGREYEAWRDFLPRDNGPSARAMDNAVAVYGGVFGDSASMISPDMATGRVVVFSVPRGWQANRGGLSERYSTAAAVVVATLDSMPAEIQHSLAEPFTYLKTERHDPPVPSFFYATQAMTQAMLGGPVVTMAPGTVGKVINGRFTYEETQSPGSRNVVAVLPGSDPRLQGQYVALGAHSDHVGFDAPVDHDSLYAFYHVVRPKGADDDGKSATPEDLPKIAALIDSLQKVHTARRDSIYNGADDDGSGSMGLLEVAEAFASAREKPKRSLLFVWHVAEEGGLLGSAYFTDHPTVPRDSIVGQINIDMIGRGGAADIAGGGPGYLQVIGPKRLSTELATIVDAEGKKFTPVFKYDYQYDADGHPQQFYCRSDHYMYARYGIPVVFLSTGGHAEYHQVTDEPQYIDYDQLARVSQLVYNIARTVGNLDHRLVVDKPKPDAKGVCVQ